MLDNQELKDYLEQSDTVSTRPFILMEWNMNVASNISKIGNYRYRPTATEGSDFSVIADTYDQNDTNNDYTGATNSDIKVDGGYDTSDNPLMFITEDKKENLLYSLEDCFYRFRPRSGINKLRYFDDRYTHFANTEMAKRPRYYIADKTDKFKYWTSYRKEDGIERGIAYSKNAQFFIDDTAPFVVYKESVPTNRIVIKMQTNVGDVDLGPFSNSFETFNDPFFGEENRTVPVKWKVQYLVGSSWVTAKEFTELDNLVNIDGYVELAYGVLKPVGVDAFTFMGTLPPGHLLPESPEIGTAYLIDATTSSSGTVAVWNGASYDGYYATYGWYVRQEGDQDKNGIATELVSVPSFTVDGQTTYREFCNIQGIRVVVETMNVYNSTFDLIELSPRLVVDVSDRTEAFSVTKSLSDLGLDGLPVGQLIAGTGQMNVFDYDDAFNSNNPNSIIRNHLLSKFQVKVYEIISIPGSKNVFVPVKTLYSDLPFEEGKGTRDIALELKDLMFYFDSMIAPQLLLEDVSLSTAISILLDSIGFSNYIFKRVEGETDPVIPHFFVSPDVSVSEVLQELAISTQTGMYFDEDNNLVIVSKNYMLPISSIPSEGGRQTDIVLSGTKDFERSGVVKNARTSQTLNNIVSVSSYTNKIYNAGVIRYSRRHIQKSYGSLKQASVIDNDKTWIYKPVLLWEVAPSESTKAKNDEQSTQSNYALSAIPLATSLSSSVPEVVYQGGQYSIINNVMDFGQGIQWIARYNGYFYANGEIIKYDAVEFNVQGVGTVWINSGSEYQDYFAKVAFNGRIYPTGRIRIFAEPKYSVTDGVATPVIGPVLKHGRGQFGTDIVSHNAGLSQYWSNNANVHGINMKSKYLFGTPRSYEAEYAYSVFYDISKVKIVNKVGTITLSTTSNIAVGDQIFISGISETFAKKFNGSFKVTAVAGTKISFAIQAKDISEKTVALGRAYVYDSITIPDASNIYVGDTVTLVEGIGRLSKATRVSQIIFSTVTNDPDTIILNKPVGKIIEKDVVDPVTGNTVVNTLLFEDKVYSKNGAASVSLAYDQKASKSIRTGIIKNFLSTEYTSETEPTKLVPGTIQSSALVFSGPDFKNNDGIDFVSYIHKNVAVDRPGKKFTHFGTRLRIVGELVASDQTSSQSKQVPLGSSSYYETLDSVGGKLEFRGGSAGLGILVNPNTNNGYFLEVIALSETNVSNYANNGNIHNVILYKVGRQKDDLEFEGEIQDSDDAIPTKLWGATAPIIVDDGKFTGQYRQVNEQKPTVYDVAVEYEDLDNGKTRKFYIYFNNDLVGTAIDTSPLTEHSGNTALFVRGSTKAMFENIYALAHNYSQNTIDTLSTPVNAAFGSSEITVNQSFRKYAMSGIVQSTYLSNIDHKLGPRYNIYFDEFGTIMREAAYFNVKYDKAYPALYAKMSPTFNSIKGYTVSGFIAGPYDAEFLIFNNTDTVLSLDETTGNYLRIQGVTFTQQSQHDYTLDEYMSKTSDLSDIAFGETDSLENVLNQQQTYQDIKNSRVSYGRQEFSLQSSYLQSSDAAADMMKWLVSKITKPRKSIGMEIFNMPNLQLGDIVEIDYSVDDINQVNNGRYVIYSIESQNDQNGPSMTVYLSEVV